MPPLLWRKWLLFKKILQKDLKTQLSQSSGLPQTKCPISNLNLHVVGENIPRGCRHCRGKRKRKEKATKVNSADIKKKKECFNGTNVSLLVKESQLECHQKWQNHFNIIAVIHSSFISTEVWSQICQGERWKIPRIVRKWSGLMNITLEREN